MFARHYLYEPLLFSPSQAFDTSSHVQPPLLDDDEVSAWLAVLIWISLDQAIGVSPGFFSHRPPFPRAWLSSRQALSRFSPRTYVIHDISKLPLHEPCS